MEARAVGQVQVSWANPVGHQREDGRECHVSGEDLIVSLLVVTPFHQCPNPMVLMRDKLWDMVGCPGLGHMGRALVSPLCFLAPLRALTKPLREIFLAYLVGTGGGEEGRHLAAVCVCVCVCVCI